MPMMEKSGFFEKFLRRIFLTSSSMQEKRIFFYCGEKRIFYYGKKTEMQAAGGSGQNKYLQLTGQCGCVILLNPKCK